MGVGGCPLLIGELDIVSYFTLAACAECVRDVAGAKKQPLPTASSGACWLALDSVCKREAQLPVGRHCLPPVGGGGAVGNNQHSTLMNLRGLAAKPPVAWVCLCLHLGGGGVSWAMHQVYTCVRVLAGAKTLGTTSHWQLLHVAVSCCNQHLEAASGKTVGHHPVSNID